MKRLAVTMTLVLALTAGGAVAAPAPVDYSGRFQPSGALTFAVARHDGHKVVAKFMFSQFPLVKCDHGANTETASLRYAVRIKHTRFHTVAILGTRQDPRSELILRGHLGSHGSAAGKMRVFGSKVPVDDTTHGRHDRCNSRLVSWTAKRQHSH